MSKRSPIRHGKVASRRNSVASIDLAELDWSNWFAYGDPRECVKLKVRHPGSGPGWETWWRVWCRHSDRAGLEMQDGVLRWVWHENDADWQGVHKRAPTEGGE